uniref:Immunoglobulin V-set domain-containing protein n=1 Tax=Neovison vison TaxID=452646 RepID=A0A8C7A041_NEOVI
MVWIPVLLMVPSYYTGIDSCLSQPILIQPPSISASLGETARLTCNFSNDFSVGSYQKSLYQQKPRTPPQHLLRFLSYLNKHQSFRVPSRFSGSKDTSANVDDYCAKGHGSGKEKGVGGNWRGRQTMKDCGLSGSN